MNTDAGRKAKVFFKLKNNVVFGKNMENVGEHRDIKLVTIEKRKYYLVSEPNYHATKFSPENLLALEIKRTQILMNKPIYLGLSVLEISKIVMYEFLNDYKKPKHGEKAKLCYMDTNSLIVYINTDDDIYKDIADIKDVKTRFVTL